MYLFSKDRSSKEMICYGGIFYRWCDCIVEKAKRNQRVYTNIPNRENKICICIYYNRNDIVYCGANVDGSQ